MVEKRVYASAKEIFFGVERHIFTRYWYAIAHSFTVYGIYLLLSWQIPLKVFAFALFYTYGVAGIGLTVGGHRLWSHRSFKATPFLKLILIYMHTAAGQLPVFEYVRVHRTHHKWADTDSDPHNAQKGFWYSQILWTMMKDRPAMIEKREALNFSDIDTDPFVRFQSKYYTQFATVAMFLVPMSITYYLWDGLEGCNGIIIFLRLISLCFTQHILLTHGSFLANSASHLFGTKPFKIDTYARDNWLLSMLTMGEGFHNYHHVFPWDYKISEGGFGLFNFSTGFIEICAKLGLAYDLRTATPSMVEYKVENLGDGSHPLHNSINEEGEHKHSGIVPGLWGVEDEDTTPEDLKQLTVIHKAKAG